MIDCIFRHPHYHSGAVIARLAVSGATLFWAIVVLVENDALAITRYGAPLTAIVGENWIAGAFAVIAVGSIYRICRLLPPNPWGILPYLSMALLWVYADLMILATRPWQPTALGWVTVGVFLAAFALVANPRHSTSGCRVPGP